MKKNNRLLIVVFAVLALIIGVLKGVDYYRYTKVSKERVSSIQAEFVGETAPSQELSMSMFDVTVYTETGSVYSARSFDIDEKKAPAHGDSFDTRTGKYRSIIKTGKVTKRENKNVDSGPKARQKSGSETFFSNRARV